MKYIPFIKSCFLELEECGWTGEDGVTSLSMLKKDEGEAAVLSYFGGDLYGLSVEDLTTGNVYVDQFVTYRMACDFARAFML